jgi:hypothetical protein
MYFGPLAPEQEAAKGGSYRDNIGALHAALLSELAVRVLRT